MRVRRDELDEALATLGAVLLDEGTPFELLAIGGSGLLLLGLVDRPTADLDVIALRQHGTFHKLEGLPPVLADAARRVGDALGLAPGWLNTGPSSLMDFELPAGWEGRLVTLQYDGLSLHLASRRDQICFKLYAAVDRGPDDKHFEDLKGLDPTDDELVFAARWVVTHDPSEAFRRELVGCLSHLGLEVSDDEFP